MEITVTIDDNGDEIWKVLESFVWNCVDRIVWIVLSVVDQFTLIKYFLVQQNELWSFYKPNIVYSIENLKGKPSFGPRRSTSRSWNFRISVNFREPVRKNKIENQKSDPI